MSQDESDPYHLNHRITGNFGQPYEKEHTKHTEHINNEKIKLILIKKINKKPI